jgi:preprotein translocase subunit SecG
METIIITVNVILAIILIILVLFQRSEGGALGLGLSQDNFASTRTVGNFLTKSTAIIAALFIISSISLVILSKSELEQKQSVIERIEEEKESDSPKIPESQK